MGRWPDTLLGDAASHVSHGSNGASQAIIDGGSYAQFLEYGVNPKALEAYNQQLCGPVSEVVYIIPAQVLWAFEYGE